MADHNDLGAKGEQIAAAFLSKKGYKILERNWRFSRAEIDIIAKWEASNTLIFVEVKTRSDNYYGEPEFFFTQKKEILLQDAASRYCFEQEHDWEIRFDLVTVLLRNNQEIVKHYQDVFF